jgi:hypothetical protein
MIVATHPKHMILFKVAFLYAAATLLFTACGSTRDKQGIKVASGETTFHTDAEDYSKRIAVGGELNPSVGESIYIKDTVSIESLRQMMAAGISLESKQKMKDLTNQRFFNLTVMVKNGGTVEDTKFLVRWLDDRDGRKPVETDLGFDKSSNSYIGHSSDANLSLSCVASAKSTGVDFCEVMQLQVNVAGLKLPYLVVVRMADIQVKSASLPNIEKTKDEFLTMPDKRQRHHIVALAEEVKTCLVLNTVGVVNDVSRFALSFADAKLPSSVRIWGDYTRVDSLTRSIEKPVASSLIEPYRTRLSIVSSVEQNASDYMTVSLTYMDDKPITTTTRVGDNSGVVGNILLRFDFR